MAIPRRDDQIERGALPTRRDLQPVIAERQSPGQPQERIGCGRAFFATAVFERDPPLDPVGRARQAQRQLHGFRLGGGDPHRWQAERRGSSFL